jgi:hypothetical protein
VSSERPIYFLHPRKTGGTSLNFAFYALSGRDPAWIHAAIRNAPDRALTIHGRTYVAGNPERLGQGDYFYGSSHQPLHMLSLKSNTFVFAAFRDPSDRVVSHYRMLMSYIQNGINKPFMKFERDWVGNSFDDFLDRLPHERLLNQLWMLTADFKVSSAMATLRALDHVLVLDRLPEGIGILGSRLGFKLPVRHDRPSSTPFVLSSTSQKRLTQLVEPEQHLLEEIRLHLKDFGYR